MSAHAEAFDELAGSDKARLSKELELADAKISKQRAELDKLRAFKAEADHKLESKEVALAKADKGLKLKALARARLGKAITTAAKTSRLDTVHHFLKSDSSYFLKKMDEVNIRTEAFDACIG